MKVSSSLVGKASLYNFCRSEAAPKVKPHLTCFHNIQVRARPTPLGTPQNHLTQVEILEEVLRPSYGEAPTFLTVRAFPTRC